MSRLLLLFIMSSRGITCPGAYPDDGIVAVIVTLFNFGDNEN